MVRFFFDGEWRILIEGEEAEEEERGEEETTKKKENAKAGCFLNIQGYRDV